MEIVVPLVVGGLTGLSAAVACGAEPRAPRVPPAELVSHTLESVAEKLPRELVDNDLLKKIARSWAALVPAHRLGLVIEDDEARLACLLLSSGVCGIALTVVSLSPIGFVPGLLAPFGVGAARDTFDRRREQHDVEEAMPEAFTALSMSLASGHSLAQGMRFVGAHAQEPVHTEFLRVAAAIDCGVSATDALDDLLARIDAPGLSLVTLALKVSQRTGAPLADLLSEASSMVGERIELKRRLDVKTSQARMSAHMVSAMPAGMCAVLALLSAGLSFDAALEVFCANRRSTLALRLERACMAWQVGVGTREDELLTAARDLDVRALETFAITAGQALALGAPLAETLAAQSREIRAAHRAAVEREIERAPVKLLIPTGTLILPALLLSILGPLLGAGGMM